MRDRALLEGYMHEYLEYDVTYKQNTQYFVNYIVNVCSLGDTIAKISFENFLDSIRYFNKNAKINAESTALSYLEGVKAFYSFLVTKGYSEDIFDRVTIMNRVNKVIKELNLSTKKERDIFAEETIIEILSKLDRYIESTDYKNEDKVRFYNWSKLRIFIKLMLIAPAKKKVISSIKISDFDMEEHTVKINGVLISLPNALYRDIRFYLDIKNSSKDDQEDFLFDKGNTYKNINGWFYYFLKEYNIIDLSEIKTDTYGIEVIMRTALQSMATNGANPILLAKINNVNVDTLDKYYLNAIIGTEIDRLINNEVSKNIYYRFI